ncbi:conserved hypothetical protein [uncultured Desulfobacterium sp.]|uniref:Uncharacterized protein n=1 Tax=uncultured Desulfobacterium sp. TaxID=201089 RepID=A0A445MSR7_9BACT|nr:conserved hypothetical protein [uncultured Desulfobacterium sp.]
MYTNKKIRFVGFFRFFLFIILATGLGCGITKSMVGAITSEEPVIKKKIIVFPPINHCGLTQEKAAKISIDLAETLKEEPQLLLCNSTGDFPSPSEGDMNQYGVVYNRPEITEKAKAMNINGLILPYIPPIEESGGRSGIWPFRYDSKIYKMSLVTNVIDPVNGCLYLTELGSCEVKFPSDEIKDLSEHDIHEKVMEEAMPGLIKRQAKAIIDRLVKEPWTGKIAEVDNGIIKINAGSDAGIFPDQIFSVYSPGESIESKSGRTFTLLGEKLGTIKAVTVNAEDTIAETVEGGPFYAGQTIVFNP